MMLFQFRKISSNGMHKINLLMENVSSITGFPGLEGRVKMRLVLWLASFELIWNQNYPCTCILHNLLRTMSAEIYTPKAFVDSRDESGNVIDGEWRNAEVSPYFVDIPPTNVRNVHKNVCEY